MLLTATYILTINVKILAKKMCTIAIFSQLLFSFLVRKVANSAKKTPKCFQKKVSVCHHQLTHI